MPLPTYHYPPPDDDPSDSEYARWMHAEMLRLQHALDAARDVMDTTPSLDTLRAMYPVASGSLHPVDMFNAERMANAFHDGCITKGWTPLDGVIKLYAKRGTSLDTPVKRAAFALLLTMVGSEE